MSSYVACNGPNGAVSELVSFYSLPSSVIDTSTGHTVLEAAYCFYNIATTVPFEMVLRDALILAKREGFDVFNALDMMDNGPLMEKLKFGIGDGALHYYLYNYRLQTLESADVGLVML
jgi:glycylpeptide N-tetradecanoyltransferase